jgi:hypothetical protein
MFNLKINVLFLEKLMSAIYSNYEYCITLMKRIYKYTQEFLTFIARSNRPYVRERITITLRIECQTEKSGTIIISTRGFCDEIFENIDCDSRKERELELTKKLTHVIDRIINLRQS